MKKSKILSLLLAIMMVVSTMSCLAVIANAAIVASDGEYDEEGNLVEAYWELEDDGTLTIYRDCNPTWGEHRAQITSIVLGANVTRIPNSAFVGCVNLTEIEFTNGLDTIEAGAFQNLDALKTVKIASVRYIGDYAFYDCDSLEEVYIGGGLEYSEDNPIGSNIFKSCDSLTFVWFGNGTRSIGYGMFDDCVSLVTVDMPDSIVDIAKLAFEGCTSLSAIVIPDSVESVGDYAFHDCASAQSLYIGHEVEYFGESVFGNNVSLVDVEIKCAMPTISYGMFQGCSSLKAIDLPQGVQTIGASAFMGCSALESVTIPSTTTMIGESAFDGTAITEITIPWNVVDIGMGAFTNCKSLTDINVAYGNSSYASVDGALYDISLDTLLCCPAGKTGTYTINNGTITISGSAFIGCDGLTLIEAPSSIDSIANNAFNGCDEALVISTGCVTPLADFAAKRGISTELIHSDETVWTETIAPGCTTEGEKSESCADCGEAFTSQVIDALGHQYDAGVVTKEATCEEDGVVTITCQRAGCGDSYTVVIPANNHKYDAGVVVLEPTCEGTGIKRFTCQNAGCYDYYEIDLPATGHNYTTTVTKEATCEEDGEETCSCDRCGDYTVNVIPALGHDYVETITKFATCIETGKKKSTCSHCGDSYETSYTGNHADPVTVVVNATCEEAGKSGQWCAVCSQFIGEVVEIPATGHTMLDGTCVTCGHSDGSATEPTPQPQPNVRPETPKMKLVRNEVTGLSVTWSAVDGAASYRVYRRGAGDKYWTYITTVTGTSYLDAKATTGNYWRYTVRAVGQNGLYSGYENGIYIKRVDTPAMKKLTNTSAGINVTWSAVSNAKEYRVYRRGAGETTWTYIGTVTGTSYLDTAVKNASGQYFRYTVRAVDGYYSNFESGIYIKRA